MGNKQNLEKEENSFNFEILRYEKKSGLMIF
jgi:hypothetical protein